jgi:hypothetical protein
MRIKILKEFTGKVGSESILFREGDILDLDDEAASNFVRGHYAEQVAAVKVQIKPDVKEAIKIKRGK